MNAEQLRDLGFRLEGRAPGGRLRNRNRWPPARRDLDSSAMGSSTKTTAIILAAGQGTRMKSELPKVMHALCGRPLVYFPVRAALDAGVDDVVVVVGHGKELVESYVPGDGC